MIDVIPIYKDINECAEGTGGCAQMCTNTVGSYDCSCSSGYRMASDSHGCDGKSNSITAPDILQAGDPSITNGKIYVEIL